MPDIPKLVQPPLPPPPHRVTLSRKAGWSLPPNTRKVDRSTEFGNPFRVGDTVEGRAVHTVEQSLDLYRAYATARIHQPTWQALKGLNLACWCKPANPCHADILLTLLNPTPPRPLPPPSKGN